MGYTSTKSGIQHDLTYATDGQTHKSANLTSKNWDLKTNNHGDTNQRTLRGYWPQKLSKLTFNGLVSLKHQPISGFRWNNFRRTWATQSPMAPMHPSIRSNVFFPPLNQHEPPVKPSQQPAVLCITLILMTWGHRCDDKIPDQDGGF